MPVYFIQAGEDGPIKIGYAANVQRRIAALRTACPTELRELGYIDGDQAAVPKRQRKRMNTPDREVDLPPPDIFRGQWWFWTPLFRVLFWFDRR